MKTPQALTRLYGHHCLRKPKPSVHSNAWLPTAAIAQGEYREEKKIFHAEIVVDSAKVFAEMKAYQPIPTIADFINEDGCDNLKETIEANYRKVKREILSLVDSEIQRIKNTPGLSHLIPNK